MIDKIIGLLTAFFTLITGVIASCTEKPASPPPAAPGSSTVIVVNPHPPSSPPASQPTLPPVVILPDACKSVEKIQTYQFPGIEGVRCNSKIASSDSISGPDIVSPMPLKEFFRQVDRNVYLIESYQKIIQGSTEAEAAANIYNARSVVELTEFLAVNINTLRASVGTVSADFEAVLRKAIFHAEKINEYREKYSKM